jgi:glycosyltransferase involved in cell wall biosynthesis
MEKPAEILISVLLPTFNNARTIQATLDSIGWVDEILVVDSFSQDETLETCRKFGLRRGCTVRILQHEYLNSAKQKNWAAPQCLHEWVLQMDTDEVLEPGSKEEIMQALQSVPSGVDAFRLPRKNFVLGKWLRHGGLYPDYQVRLFRKGRGRWQDREVHAHVFVAGEIRTLQHAILHEGMPSLSRQVSNLNRYTRYEADELAKQGRKFSAYRLLVHPWLTFAYRYFWQQGFRDGWRGLILAGYAAIYQFLVWAKRWEMEELDLEKSPP